MHMQAEKIAKVLEANAKYTEALEDENRKLKEKVASFQEKEKRASLQPVVSRLELLTGEELTDTLKEKIANDPDFVHLLDKLAQDQTVSPFGDVSQTSSSSDNASKTPEDRFASWATDM